MITAGHLPAGGEEFFATIKRPGLEEVIEDDDGRKLRFPSAASATRHALAVIRAQALASVPKPVENPDDALRRQWKLDRAEELRKEREAFEMRNVKVVVRKRRIP